MGQRHPLSQLLVVEVVEQVDATQLPQCDGRLADGRLARERVLARVRVRTG